MRVLLLSPYPQTIAGPIAAAGDELITFNGEPNDWPEADFIVSYGYRHIIREPQVSKYAGRMINLHIAYLPWNRGADPNFWSIYDNTPRGVSIHQIDRGIDTGPLLFRHFVNFGDDETLGSSYALLRLQIERLFAERWPTIRVGDHQPIITCTIGSYHRSVDKDPIFSRLPLGWNTRVETLMALGQEARSRAR
jgi:methionyl-tRNA formyltransferase